MRLSIAALVSTAGIAAGAALPRSEPSAIVSGYTNADAGFPQTPSPLGSLATAFGSASQIEAIETAPPKGSASGAAPPRVSSDPTGFTSHGPYFGPAPTTTGAVSNSPAAETIGPLPPNPTATYYNPQGGLLNQQPIPYAPAGGAGTNGTEPRYMVNSDFDFQSITLGLYQEWIELDLFYNGLAVFSTEDFLRAGLTAEDRALIAFMAQQETGHATLLSNMLGPAAPKQCTYNYPFTNVREFIDFNQKLTKWGEAGVWGFLPHLDAREVAQLLSQSIATETRQQMSFRQMLGLHPYPFWFSTGIPQSWAWTYLAPYISSCPENTTRLAWQNFPTLHIVNQGNPNRFSPNNTALNETVGNRPADPSRGDIPDSESCVNLNVTGYGCGPAISRNKTEPLSFPGKKVYFEWDTPGKPVGPNNSYITATTAKGAPKWAAWVSQLNLTYTPLTSTGDTSGFTYQPASEVYEGDPAANGTMFIALTDENPFLTPFNLSFINPHVAALGLYTAG